MTETRGILAYGAHVPYRRLDRAAISDVMGSGGGRGWRAVASFDQDTTTMGVEAARQALAGASSDLAPDALWFSTVAPAYVDKTNATTVHAALRLDAAVPALDLGGAVRSAVGALRAALTGSGRTLVVAADLRVGLPTSADESAGGDAAAAILTGSSADGPLLAEYLGGASATAEFLDRWRTPGDATSRTWEERFGEQAYGPLVDQAWTAALADTGLTADDIDSAIVTGLHGRAVKRLGGRLGVAVADDLAGTVGNSGAAHPALLLADTLDTADAGQVVALVVLADGVEVLILRTTDALAAGRPSRSVAAQVEHRADVTYPTYLAWRGLLEVQPPNRPAPNRPSASASLRRSDWKHGFVGSRVGIGGGAVDDMEPAPMADTEGTIATFTVDRLAYSPSPPIVFAVVDFDGGGRMPVELTDVDPAEVAVGGRVAMTFRRLHTADGIHNYFWKARPVRG
jgi:3-hydroxy-3-methylglutaryl CoA synthase